VPQPSLQSDKSVQIHIFDLSDPFDQIAKANDVLHPFFNRQGLLAKYKLKRIRERPLVCIVIATEISVLQNLREIVYNSTCTLPCEARIQSDFLDESGGGQCFVTNRTPVQVGIIRAGISGRATF
jgi:hypothetical protein